MSDNLICTCQRNGPERDSHDFGCPQRKRGVSDLGAPHDKMLLVKVLSNFSREHESSGLFKDGEWFFVTHMEPMRLEPMRGEPLAWRERADQSWTRVARVEEAPGYHRRAPDLSDAEIVAYMKAIIEDRVYSRHGNNYRVHAVMPNNLIQFEDQWWPTVRYTCEPQTDKVFYRSVRDFYEHFRLVP